MSRQKIKWTAEEQEALHAGVRKHSVGKWKAILSDPQFASSLANRSNIDLKDKWRNMTGCGNGSGRTPRVEEATSNLPLAYPEPLSAVPLINDGGMSEPSRSSVDRSTALDFEEMILEALKSIEDPNGPDVNAILNFIEERYDLPMNFMRLATSKLRRLVLSGDIVKVDNRYKLKGAASSGAGTSVQEDDVRANNTDLETETLEDLARFAAHAVAAAENKEQEAIKACQESDKIAELLEESMAMLKLAEELHEQCLRDGMVVLTP